MVDFVGEGGAERDAVLMLGTRGVDVLVGYGGRLDVEILSEGLFPETSFLSSIVGTYNEARAQRELTRSTCGRFGRCETALTSIWRGPG